MIFQIFLTCFLSYILKSVSKHSDFIFYVFFYSNPHNFWENDTHINDYFVSNQNCFLLKIWKFVNQNNEWMFLGNRVCHQNNRVFKKYLSQYLIVLQLNWGNFDYAKVLIHFRSFFKMYDKKEAEERPEADSKASSRHIFSQSELPKWNQNLPIIIFCYISFSIISENKIYTQKIFLKNTIILVA